MGIHPVAIGAMLNNRWIRALIVMAACISLLSITYGDLLRDPGGHMFRGNGDGLKNYFVFGYHVRYDADLMQFEGMNHPFGNQISYPDAQPALSGATRLAARIFPALRDQTPAIINLAALISIAITALSIHLILMHFGVGWMYAAFAGIALSYCSPQLIRMEAGHHALSYGWTITLPIYFLLRTSTSKRPWITAIMGGATTFLALYLHPYVGMIATCLIGCTVLLLARTLLIRREGSRLGAQFLLLLAPIVSFLFIQRLTDHHAESADHPLGFFDYVATLNNLLSPPHDGRSPLHLLLFPEQMEQGFEGTSYVGVAGLLGVVAIVIWLLWSFVEKRSIVSGPAGWPKELSALLLASIPLLAFSFGFPFSRTLGILPWDIPLVGQFRSPGRFAWAFYYTLGVAVLYSGWLFYRTYSRKWKVAATLVLLSLPALYLYEGYYVNRSISTTIQRDRNVFNKMQLTTDEVLLLDHVDTKLYTAMVAVPNYLIGSDEVSLGSSDEAKLKTQLLAYHTGIPLMSFALARVGVSETHEQIGVFTPPWYPRPISKRIASDVMLLIVVGGEPANDYERAVLGLCERITQVGEVGLYRIRASELFRDRTEELFIRLEQLRSEQPTLNGWVSTTDDARVYHFAMDDQPASHIYAGGGAHGGLKSEVNSVAHVPIGGLRDGQDYWASYWYYNKGPLRCHALTCIAERDPITEKEEWIECSDARYGRVVNGDWTLVELPFTARADREYRVFTEGQSHYTDSVWIDEAMIRPRNAETFRVLQEENGRIKKVLYNGHLLTRPQ